MNLSQDLVDNFQNDGVVLLSGVFADWVKTLRDGIDWNMSNPSYRERTYRPDDGSAPFFQDHCTWNDNEYYRDFVKNSSAGAIAASLMKSKTARIFHDHILVKEPGNSVVTPWHQDQPYYLVEGQQTVSFWLPLDPISRDRTIEYVAGSHLWDKSFRPMRFDGTPLFPGDDSEAVPDVASRRDELDIRGWEMEPGDAVAFSFRTIHGAPANNSAVRRRVISTRWTGDDARFVVRPAQTSPAFPDVVYEDGAPFGGDQFPIIYPAA